MWSWYLKIALFHSHVDCKYRPFAAILNLLFGHGPFRRSSQVLGALSKKSTTGTNIFQKFLTFFSLSPPSNVLLRMDGLEHMGFLQVLSLFRMAILCHTSPFLSVIEWPSGLWLPDTWSQCSLAGGTAEQKWNGRERVNYDSCLLPSFFSMPKKSLMLFLFTNIVCQVFMYALRSGLPLNLIVMRKN